MKEVLPSTQDSEAPPPERDEKAPYLKERRAWARRRSIQTFMTSRDLTPAKWAKLAGVSPNPIYNLLNKHSASMSMSTMERLAKAAGASVSEVFGESPTQARQADVILAKVHAGSGQWRSTYEVPGAPTGKLPILPGLQIDEAVWIADEHANKVYRAKSLVGVQGFGTLGKRGILEGDRVLVQRTRGGNFEVTIRQVDGVRKNGAELVFTSTDQRFSTRVPIVPWPYDGRAWEQEGDQFVIRGRVLLGQLLDDDV